MKKLNVQTMTHLIQQTVLGIQFWSLKCTTATVRYEYFHSFSPGLLEMARLYENKPLQNAFKRIQHYIYLCKFYSILIILLLKIT